jgi:hypothetical protein
VFASSAVASNQSAFSITCRRPRPWWWRLLRLLSWRSWRVGR